MNAPAGLKYTKNDEWIRVEGTTGAVGLTDYAQEQLSDIVYVEVSAGAGASVKQGDTIASVESVKAAADAYSPVSGTVTEVNESLRDSPDAINSDPYGKAWLIKLTLVDPAELAGLMDAAAYQKYCEERGH